MRKGLPATALCCALLASALAALVDCPGEGIMGAPGLASVLASPSPAGSWSQTDWSGGETGVPPQAGAWTSAYDRYCAGENEDPSVAGGLGIQYAGGGIAAHLVVSEVYPRISDGWIELYNPTAAPIDLTSPVAYRLERARDNENADPDIFVRFGDASDATFPGGTVVPAYGHYLVVDNDTNNNVLRGLADALVHRSVALNDNYVVYLGTGAIDNKFDPNIVDFVGFGSALDYEGPGPAPGPSADTHSVERRAWAGATAASMAAGPDANTGNGYDTDNNASDWVDQPRPSPENHTDTEAPPLGYWPSAYAESSVFDAGVPVDWKIISWSKITPAGTSTAVYARAGGTPDAYDGTWGPWLACANGGEVPAASSRYIQYKVNLSTSNKDVTPELLDVTIGYAPVLTWTQAGWGGGTTKPAVESGAWTSAYQKYYGGDNIDTNPSLGGVSLAADPLPAWWAREDVPGAGWHGMCLAGTRAHVYEMTSSAFWRYRLENSQWGVLPDPPREGRNGAALVWDNAGSLYALLGGSYSDVAENARHYFCRYDINTGEWYGLAPTSAVNSAGQGAGDALVWVPGYAVGALDDNFLYAIVGSDTHRPAGFGRYSVKDNVWSSLASGFPWDNTDDGCSLAWAGGGYLYALRGEYDENAATYDFARFSLAGNAWDTAATTPESIWSPGGTGNGASLEWAGDGYLYATSGAAYDENYRKIFCRYDTSANSWERLADLPENIGGYNGDRLAYAGAAVGSAGGSIFCARGTDTQFWKYRLETYRPGGWLESSVFDAGQSANWGAIPWNAILPSATLRTSQAFNPSGYTLLGGTALVGGAAGNLVSNDGTYMTFRSYESQISPDNKQYLTNEVITGIGGTTYHKTKFTAGATAAEQSVKNAKKTGKFYYQPGAIGTADAGTPGDAPIGYGWATGSNIDGVIPAGTWTFTATLTSSSATGSGHIEVWVYKYDGAADARLFSIDATATDVLATTAQTTYTFAADQPSFDVYGARLKIEYWLHVETAGTSTTGAVSFETNTSTQYVVYSTPVRTQYASGVEFTGASNTRSWTKLDWSIDSAWTVGSTGVTARLWNYDLGRYALSGEDGYIGYTSSAAANTDETKTRTITTDPAHFRDASGNWSVKVTGAKTTLTQFDFEADWVEFKPTWDVASQPTSIVVEARTGGDNNPYDGGWSPWCAHASGSENASLPDGRYAQYRVELASPSGDRTPVFSSITICYTAAAAANEPPTATGVSYDSALDAGTVDRDLDYEGSGADDAIRILVTAQDPDGVADFPAGGACAVYVRDGADNEVAVIDVSSSYTDITGNARRWHCDYNPPDGCAAGKFDVKVVVRDAAGAAWTEDYGGMGRELFTVDDLLMGVPTVAPPSPLSGGEVTVSGTAARATGAAADLTAVAVVETVGGAESVIPLSAGEFSGGSYSKAYVVTAPERAMVYVRVHALSGGMLDGAATGSYVVFVPNAPPYASILLMCEGAVNPENVPTATPTLSWAFSDPDLPDDAQSAYRVQVGTSAGDNSLWDSGAVTSASNICKAPALPCGIPIYWRVKTWDNRGAEGPWSSEATFTVSELAAPVISSVVVAGGAEYTSSAQVAVEVRAARAVTMSFSSDNANWTEWEPYSPLRQYSLPPGDGTKTVYVRVVGEVGDILYASGEVTLDTTSPSVSTEYPEPRAVLENGSLTIKATVSDEHSLRSVSVVVDGEATEHEYNSETGAVEARVELADGEHWTTVRAVDAAGNVGEATWAFTVGAPPGRPEPGRPDTAIYLLIVFSIGLSALGAWYIIAHYRTMREITEQAEEWERRHGERARGEEGYPEEAELPPRGPTPPTEGRKWYVYQDKERRGPYSEADLRKLVGEGGVSKGALVWREGMGGWRKASEVEELGYRPTGPRAKAPQEDE